MAFPRKGQWITLAKEHKVGPEKDDKEPKGTLGVVVGPALRAWDPEKDGDAEEHPDRVEIEEGLYEVHLVDPKEGMLTRLKMVAYAEDLAPVTRRDQIPKKRLSTMRPDWTPTP
jgi:hypothetical protein